MHYQNAILPILGIVAVSACSQQTQREPTSPNTHAAGDVAGSEMRPAAGARGAAEQIAEARCHREETCGNVGQGQDYASLNDCLDFVRADWKADLDRLVCPGGINLGQLDECVTQINGASCNSPFDKLERVAACTQGQICVEQG